MLPRLLPLLLLALDLFPAQPASAQPHHTPNRIDSLTTVTQTVNFIRSNYIDSLTTGEEVLKFVQGVNNSEYAKLQNRPTSSNDRRFGTKSFEKLDIDDNGLTDILFNGYFPASRRFMSLLIMSHADGKYEIIELPKERAHRFFAAKTLHQNGRNLLEITTQVLTSKTRRIRKRGEWLLFDSTYFHARRDTLTWYHSWLVENHYSGFRQIDTLRFYFGGGMARGGYEITAIGDSLILDKSCEIGSPKTQWDSGGVFTSRMNRMISQKLYGLLNEMDFEKMKKIYPGAGSDRTSGDLEISYDQGKKKCVWDDGLDGTYGLTALENMLWGFLKLQNWKSIKTGGPNYYVIRDHYFYY